MTDKVISPLRRRMVEDMTVRGFTPATQRGYLRAVADFTAFFGRPPDQAARRDVGDGRFCSSGIPPQSTAWWRKRFWPN